MSLLCLVVVGLLWEIAGLWGAGDETIFPPLHLVLWRVLGLLTNPEFLARDFLGSAQRFIAGLVLSVPFAILLGIVCGRSDVAARALNPIVNFTYPLPKVAVLPVFLVIFGIGDAGKIALIAVGAFYPVFVNVYGGSLRLKTSPLEDIVRIYRLRGSQLWWQLAVKGIWPDILIGLKSAFAYALTLVVVSEFTVSNNGLGNFVWRSWDQFRVNDMYAGIFILCVIGWILQEILDGLLGRALKSR